MSIYADPERVEVVIKSARVSAEWELEETRAVFRKVFGAGGEDYLKALREEARIDDEIRQLPPAPPEVRRGLKRWWGWKKRSG